MDNSDKQLLKTLTGEHYMISRVHFTCPSVATFTDVLRKLKCIEVDHSQNQWVWLYAHEACEIQFSVPYKDIPSDRHPIVLGRIQIKSETEGFLNLNSFERTTKAITFFDKHLGRHVLEFTDVEILTKILSPEEAKPGAHSRFFSNEKRPNKAEILENKLKDMLESAGTSPLETLMALSNFAESENKRFESVERLPCNFYEESGIKSLETTLRMREIVAMRHWSGDTDFTLGDLASAITSRMSSVPLPTRNSEKGNRNGFR